ncbi:MAG: helix-turn-helix domain-containing protein [Dehalococcoidia bacterium]
MKHVNQSKTMLTASELAHILNGHINTVRRWSNRGILKVYRIVPRRDRRFSKEDIESFLAQNPQVRYRNGKVPIL